MNIGDLVYDKLDPARRPMVIIEDHVETPRPRTLGEWWRGAPPHAPEVDRTQVVVRMRLDSPRIATRTVYFQGSSMHSAQQQNETHEFWENVVVPVAQLELLVGPARRPALERSA
jgi:hypothetical protein